MASEVADETGLLMSSELYPRGRTGRVTGKWNSESDVHISILNQSSPN